MTTKLTVWGLPLWLLLAVAAACTGKKETTRPTVETITESVYASGVVKSRDQYQLFPTVSGIIKQVRVTEGDLVKEGQVLMQVENEAARLTSENARLAAEQAQVSTNAEKLNELQTAISLARTRLQTDSTLYRRQQRLWAGRIGTKVDLEQRELNYQSARAAYRTAVLRHRDLKKQLKYTARQSNNAEEISRIKADEYAIKSETSGKVYSLLREKGELVSPQSPVALIGSATDFLLELQVDEYDIAKVKAGQQVLLNLDSYKGQTFSARVSKIYPAMNERTRSFTVEAAFVTRPNVLYPNLTTEANIVIRTRKNALTIPREYLLAGSYVLNEDGNKVSVKTGLKDYRKVEILAGISKEQVLQKPAL